MNFIKLLLVICGIIIPKVRCQLTCYVCDNCEKITSNDLNFLDVCEFSDKLQPSETDAVTKPSIIVPEPGAHNSSEKNSTTSTSNSTNSTNDGDSDDNDDKLSEVGNSKNSTKKLTSNDVEDFNNGKHIGNKPKHVLTKNHTNEETSTNNKKFHNKPNSESDNEVENKKPAKFSTSSLRPGIKQEDDDVSDESDFRPIKTKKHSLSQERSLRENFKHQNASMRILKAIESDNLNNARCYILRIDDGDEVRVKRGCVRYLGNDNDTCKTLIGGEQGSAKCSLCSTPQCNSAMKVNILQNLFFITLLLSVFRNKFW